MASESRAATRPAVDYRFPKPEERPLVFAGSTVLLGTSEPWFGLGEVTARCLVPYGYEVKILSETPGAVNPRYVADGRAEVGATNPSIARNAHAGSGPFAGEGRRDSLRAIATVCRPSWVAVAVTQESGITDLGQIKLRRLPVRMFCGSDDVLAYYGLSREEIVSYGGSDVKERGGRDLDLLIGNLYMGYTPAAWRWLEASAMNLRFLDLPDALIERLLEAGGGERGFIPHGYVRGVDRDVQTAAHPYLVIYTRDDAPDDFVRSLAQEYDRKRQYFRETHVGFSYDPDHAALHTGIPLHSAALAYYNERGYPTA